MNVVMFVYTNIAPNASCNIKKGKFVLLSKHFRSNIQFLSRSENNDYSLN